MSILRKLLVGLAVVLGLTAGAAHHTVMSSQVGIAEFREFARMSEVELLTIDENTTIESFEREVRANAAYYRLNQPL